MAGAATGWHPLDDGVGFYRSSTNAGVVHDGGEAVLIDPDDGAIVDDLREAQGLEVTAALFTHYHQDHVEAVPEFLESFDCPILTERHVANVLEAPETYRLPCQVPFRIEVDRVLDDGEQWDWHDWTLSAHYFPGQTKYHAALLAEGGGRRLLFAGDAFTPSGMDDYCARNRNPVGAGRGYRQCLDVLEDLDPTHVFNSHVEQPFAFTDAQIDFMWENLRHREQLFEDLLAWEHPDFGLDPHWARCVPYDQTRSPGDEARIEVRVTNYADRNREFAARLELPPGWTWKRRNGRAGRERDEDRDRWSAASVAPGEDGSIKLVLSVPADVVAGIHVLPVSLQCGDRTLRRFREARVRVGS